MDTPFLSLSFSFSCPGSFLTSFFFPLTTREFSSFMLPDLLRFAVKGLLLCAGHTSSLSSSSLAIASSPWGRRLAIVFWQLVRGVQAAARCDSLDKSISAFTMPKGGR